MLDKTIETSQWDYIPVRVIQDMHRLTGACVQVEDGIIKGFFHEEKGETINEQISQSTHAG